MKEKKSLKKLKGFDVKYGWHFSGTYVQNGTSKWIQNAQSPEMVVSETAGYWSGSDY